MNQPMSDVPSDPSRIDVDRARREAKALLAAARRGQPEARAQLHRDRPDGRLRLADAIPPPVTPHSTGRPSPISWTP